MTTPRAKCAFMASSTGQLPKGVSMNVSTLRGLCAATLLTGCATAQTPKPSGAVTCSIEPERSILAANTPESVVVKVALNGVTVAAKHRASVNLAIVIDRSGSMSGQKIERAKEAAIAAVERLNENDVVSVIVFDDSVNTIVPARRVTDKPAIASAIRAVRAGNSTAIFAGVSQAASEIRKHGDSGRVNRILLLSDGQANVGPASPDELGRLGAALMKEGVSVSTVGLGLDYNEDLMTRLAAKSDGQTYFVENSDDLPRIFASELGDAFSVAARDVKLRVKFKNGATPVEIIGRDGRIERDTVTVDFNQLYGNHQKFVLIRTEFTPGEERENREFAEAFVDYRTLDSSTVQKVTTKSTVSFSRDIKAVDASVNKKVVKETVLNYNAIDTEKAILLNDARDFTGAKATNLGNVSRAREAAVRYNIAELEEEAVRQEAITRDIVAPLRPTARKAFYTEGVQLRSQQAAD